MRGSSGADLHFFDNCVVKSVHGPAANRLADQADWLERHPSPCVPPVLTRSMSHYSMPLYQEISWDELETPTDWAVFVSLMVVNLSECIWSQPAETDFDLDAHLRFMELRCQQLPGSFPEVRRWAESLDWNQPTCLTHGDPTFDNTLRDGHQLIFIDPNPPRPAVPSFAVADLSNICQSLWGYEHLKYGRPKPLIGPEYLEKFTDYPEMLRYLTVTKFIRLLSYENTHRQTFADLASDLLSRKGNPC